MSDAHLTDHEWKLKMAAEGRAIYQPGKTVEQIKAERLQLEDRAARPVTLTLTFDELSKLQDAAHEIPYLLGHATNVFAFLHSAFSGGWAGGDDPGPLSILELSEKAFRAAEDKEGKIIALTAARLREAVQQAARQEGDMK